MVESQSECILAVVLLDMQANKVAMSHANSVCMRMQKCKVAGTQKQSGQGRAAHRQAAAFL